METELVCTRQLTFQDTIFDRCLDFAHDLLRDFSREVVIALYNLDRMRL